MNHNFLFTRAMPCTPVSTQDNFISLHFAAHSSHLGYHGPESHMYRKNKEILGVNKHLYSLYSIKASKQIKLFWNFKW